MPPEPSPDADLPAIELPARYNYMAAFLTLKCNLRCSFCINLFGGSPGEGRFLSGREWLRGLNRIAARPDFPLTLQGGEPSLHPDFYEIIGGLRPDLNIDILTNLRFDVREFMRKVPPDRVKRDAPYASIRVSYHPERMDLDEIRKKCLLLLDSGYSVGIWAIEHPAQLDEVRHARDACLEAGIDFRLKEFLGVHNGELFGTYFYPGAVARKPGPPVRCRTTELLIGPSGHIHRCHSDLYEDRLRLGHISDRDLEIADTHRACHAFGFCNPCDVKIKTDRFQHYGHTSVEIQPIEDERA